MGYTLVLEVPEETYKSLAERARQRGFMPEELAVEWLVDAIQIAIDDPLESLIGAFHSNIPDWADQHDKYIGDTLLEEMRIKPVNMDATHA